MIRAKTGKTFLALLAWLILFPNAAHAEIRVTAEVRPDRVSLGEAFEVSVRVHSQGLQRGGKVEFPQRAGLRQTGHGTTESVRVVNRTATRERIETFTFVPVEAGTYRFEDVGFRHGDRFIESPPVVVEVTDRATPGSSAARDPNGGDDDGHDGDRSERETAPVDADGIPLPPPDEDVYVLAHVDRDSIHVGEPVNYTFRVYFRFPPERPSYEAPDFAGARIFDLGQSKQARRLRAHGRSYEYYDVSTLLYPERAGTFPIAPAGLTYRSSFFFSQQRRLETEPVEITVHPLPPDAPESFAGAVGDFRVQRSPLPQQLQEGDPLALSFTVSGTGNLATVPRPVLSGAHDWQVYPGRTTEETHPTPFGLQGTKTFEVLLIPPGEGELQVPDFEFAYFDPAEERYEVQQLPGEPIDVISAPPEREPPVTSIPIVLRPMRLELGPAATEPLQPWRLLLWAFPLPWVGLALLVAGRAMRRRMGRVSEPERRAAAGKRAQRSLAREEADPHALLRILDRWLHETQGLPPAPTAAEIQAALGEAAGPVLECRQKLEAAAFGGARLDTNALRKRLGQVIRRLSVAFLIIAASLAGWGTPEARADKPEKLFERALEAQSQGDFSEAVRLYERTAERTDIHVNLLYNLASAAWRAGDPGLARYAIEQAYAHAPQDRDVATNRRMIAQSIAQQGGVDNPVLPGRFSLAQVGWTALGTYLLLSVLLLAAWFSSWARWAVAGMLLLTLPPVGYGAYLFNLQTEAPPGIVRHETMLHEAPSERSSDIARLPGGEIAYLVGKQADWLKIRTGRGLTGWVPEAEWKVLPTTFVNTQHIPE